MTLQRSWEDPTRVANELACAAIERVWWPRWLSVLLVNFGQAPDLPHYADFPTSSFACFFWTM